MSPPSSCTAGRIRVSSSSLIIATTCAPPLRLTHGLPAADPPRGHRVIRSSTKSALTRHQGTLTAFRPIEVSWNDVGPDAIKQLADLAGGCPKFLRQQHRQLECHCLLLLQLLHRQSKASFLLSWCEHPVSRAEGRLSAVVTPPCRHR